MPYGSLAGWQAYALARGRTVPSTTAASSALQRATDYIQYNYVAMFAVGSSASAEVEPATYEAANYELDNPGFFSKTYTPAQMKVLTGLDSLSWQPVDAGTGRGVGADCAPVSSKIEAMLRPYMPGRYSFGMKSVGGDYL